MREPLDKDVLDKAMDRLTVTYDPNIESIEEIVNLSEEIGYLKSKTDLTDAFNIQILNQILTEKGLKEVK